MNAPDGYVGDRPGGEFLSNCRSAVLLLLALLIIAPSAMAIDEVVIKHKEDDTWSSHAEGASPWQFCHDADSSGEPFKAVAAGFIDTDGDPSNDPDKAINWKVVITNTETGDPTVLVDCSDPNDKGYHAGDEIEFDMPLHTAGPYKLKATATNAENDDDSASDTDKVDVVEVEFWAGSGEDAQEITDNGLTALKETDAEFRAEISPSRAASNVGFQMRDTNIATVSPSAATGTPQDLTVDGKKLGDTTLDARLNGDVCESMSVSVEEEEWILSFRRVKEDETSTNSSTNGLMSSLSATTSAENDEEEYTDVDDGDTVAVCVGDTAEFKYRAGGNWFLTMLSFTCDVDWENANETEENDSEGWSKAENTWSTPGTYKVTATRTWNALWFIPVSEESKTVNVDVVDVTFDSVESPICAATADHEAGTSLAEASVTPSDRELKWELMDNDIGVSWKTSDGNTTQEAVITEGDNIVAVAGSEAGTAVARVCDSVLTSCTAATKELKVLSVQLRQVGFSGAGEHQLKKTGTDSYDYNSQTFGSSGNQTISDPVWEDANQDGDTEDGEDKNDPICFTTGTTPKLSATFLITPGLTDAVSARLRAVSPSGTKLLEKEVSLNGTEMSISGSSILRPFTDPVGHYITSIHWKLSIGGGDWRDVGRSEHLTFLTLDNPKGDITAKRVQWSAAMAQGAQTKEECADKLWNAIASQTTFGDEGTDGWALLDGGSGDCDNQARCMVYAVKMLGAGPAEVELVYASTDAGEGKCLDLETHELNEDWFLLMDFNSDPSDRDWNQYEGCCQTAEHFYAITPKKKAANDYEMLKSISCQQIYCWVYWGPEHIVWTVLEEYPPPIPKP